MERKRAEAQQRRRESGGAMELFGSTELHDTRFYDSLRDRYLGKLETSLQQRFSKNKRVPYDALMVAALEIPLVWESDLKALLAEKKEQGAIIYEGFEPRQKVPKSGANNFIVSST